MTNIYFPDEEVQEDDLYFVCYMIERIARRLKQKNSYVVNAIGKAELERALSLVNVLHCLNPLEVEDEWIEEYHLTSGEFDITDVDRELVNEIPYPTQIGKVYKRLIISTEVPGENYAEIGGYEMTPMKKSVLYGIVGSFFFSFTFILNRSMSLAGGYYVWSAVLRYVYTLPILAIILIKQHKLKASLILIREQPLFWLLWSTIGFGIFYLSVSYASAHGESWLTAAAWQTTIVAGAMLAPVFKEKIPI